MFFGIIIRMYFAPGEHPPPHFHAYYNEYTATVDIRTCEIIDGNLPGRQTKFVKWGADLGNKLNIQRKHIEMGVKITLNFTFYP